MASIEHTVKDIVIKVLHCSESELALQATWKELKADSLDLVQILVGLEEAFSIEIPDEDAEKLQNLGDVVDYVTQHAVTA